MCHGLAWEEKLLYAWPGRSSRGTAGLVHAHARMHACIMLNDHTQTQKLCYIVTCDGDDLGIGDVMLLIAMVMMTGGDP